MTKDFPEWMRHIPRSLDNHNSMNNIHSNSYTHVELNCWKQSRRNLVWGGSLAIGHMAWHVWGPGFRNWCWWKTKQETERRESQRDPQIYYLERIKVQILQGVVPETLSETVKARKQWSDFFFLRILCHNKMCSDLDLERTGSVVRSTGWSFRGLGFSFHHPCVS